MAEVRELSVKSIIRRFQGRTELIGMISKRLLDVPLYILLERQKLLIDRRLQLRISQSSADESILCVDLIRLLKILKLVGQPNLNV